MTKGSVPGPYWSSSYSLPGYSHPPQIFGRCGLGCGRLSTDLGGRLDMGTVAQEQFDHWNTTLLAGDMQRRKTILYTDTCTTTHICMLLLVHQWIECKMCTLAYKCLHQSHPSTSWCCAPPRVAAFRHTTHHRHFRTGYKGKVGKVTHQSAVLFSQLCNMGMRCSSPIPKS